MADIRVEYRQGDQFVAHVGGHSIVLDQPEEAGGEDMGPTPTGLFVAGLAACVGFYAERYLRRHDLPAEGLAVDCDYVMSEERPARVARIDVQVNLPAAMPASRLRALERVVEHCTVHNSLREPPMVHIVLGEGRVAA